MTTRTLLAAVALSLALTAAPSHALLVTTIGLPGGTTADDPQTVPGTVTLVGSAFLNATGSIANEKRSPWDISTNNNDTRPYHYVKQGGSITFTFDYFLDTLEFVWGSPDRYNTLTLFTASGTLSVIPGGSPIGVDPLNSYLVTIGAEDSGEWFNQIVFTSGSPSFEFGNVRVPSPATESVPVPATIALLLPLLLGARLMRRARV